MSFEQLMPNLVMAGVTKAGTSSLFWYLIQHPEVCPPATRKEIDFFTPMRYGKPKRGTRDDYGRHFANQTGEAYRLDASPHYFDGGRLLVDAVHDHVPDAKILISLRDPVSRFWSTYRGKKDSRKLSRRVGFREFFERSVEARESGRDRLEEFNVYRPLSQGCYIESLRDWFDVFEPNVHILFFEHLVEDPRKVVGSTCDWLGIDTACVDDFNFDVRNKTVEPRSIAFSRLAYDANFRIDPLLRRFPAVKQVARSTYEVLNSRRDPEVLSAPDRQMAEAFYRPANEALREELVQRGYTLFPKWLEPSMSTR